VLFLFMAFCLWLFIQPDAIASILGTQEAVKSSHQDVHFFEFMTSASYDGFEKTMLWVIFFTALAALGYAYMLVGQVKRADTGTDKMKFVADATREGANAYMAQQGRRLVPLMVIVTLILFFTKLDAPLSLAIGRAGAFLVGATFSWLVGFIGMRLATQGNLRVAAAARTSYGTAMQLGYRTGTITGMLTDGLALLGGTLILRDVRARRRRGPSASRLSAHAPRLFMCVGGGIYTKAADVGADLVGKIEAGIPEDDPRNAATIADNVGDNVGDCAGMAADIFESAEVTIVAAMILGYASSRPWKASSSRSWCGRSASSARSSARAACGRATRTRRTRRCTGPPGLHDRQRHLRRRLHPPRARLPEVRRRLREELPQALSGLQGHRGVREAARYPAGHFGANAESEPDLKSATC
jgi:K(+)-stimulated pyrophosphate-energized sodium pump